MLSLDIVGMATGALLIFGAVATILTAARRMLGPGDRFGVAFIFGLVIAAAALIYFSASSMLSVSHGAYFSVLQMTSSALA